MRSSSWLIVLVCLITVSRGYDFTNLRIVNFTDDEVVDMANERLLTGDSSTVSDSRSHHVQEQMPGSTTTPNQTPMHWILSRLYGGGGGLNETERRRLREETSRAGVGSGHVDKEQVDQDGRRGNDTRKYDATVPDEEAIRYNVSYLGLKDPFARYSTRLSYDYSIDISEPHDNRRGSMLSLLNGTVFPFGSVGAMMALGWSGTSNDTSRHSRHTHYDAGGTNSSGNASAASGDRAGNADSHSSTSPPSSSSSSSSGTSSLKPHSEGLSGVWLAFTSQHAVTGGYTLQSSRVSATNNVVFHNVTFRSNITIDAQGHFTFSFSMGTVDESDQDDGLAAAAAAAANTTHGTTTSSSSYLNMFDQQDSHDERQRVREERRRKGTKPTWLDGPRCVELDAITNNTEAAFRMRCEGIKVDINEA